MTKTRFKCKSGDVKILWVDWQNGDSYEVEFYFRNDHLWSFQAEGVRDLMNCLVKLTDEWKRLAEEVKPKK